MSVGPLVWKEALLKPEVRVEISAGTLSIERAQVRSELALAEITAVYLANMSAPPFSYMWAVEAVADDARSVKFSVGGFGFAGFAADDYKKAARGLLTELQAIGSNARCFDGTRPTLSTKLAGATALLCVMGYVSFIMWRDVDAADKLMVAAILLAFFAFMAGSFWWKFRDRSLARPISLDDAVARFSEQ